MASNDEIVKYHEGYITATLPEKKAKYDIGKEKKGLFVIVAQCDFESNDYRYLPYDKDVELLTTLFNLKSGGQDFDDNVKVRTDDGAVTTAPEFDTFMENDVLGYQQDPSFVMFFLMAHGMHNDIFLASGEDCAQRQCIHDTPACPRRHYETDIIKKVQDRYPNIPKIFFIHLCRGTVRVMVPDINVAMADDENYIPERSDTIIIFPCSKDHPAFVPDCGSIFTNKLVEESLNMRTRLHEAQQEEELRRLSERGRFMHLALSLEDFCGGWIHDIIRHASTEVTWLTFHETGNRSEKTQPEYCTTLRYKLSWIEILTSQGLIDGPIV